MTANVLIVAIDGLRPSALGAYGNTSFATPALDRFATQSLLLDCCYAPSVDLDVNYRALWNLIHPFQSKDRVISLPKLMSDRGYTTKLATDEPQLNSFAAAAEFAEVVNVADASKASASYERAADASDRALARLLTAASEVIERTHSEGPQFIWIHARGMYGPWDAPLELQQTLLDDGDPPPVESATPPDFFVTPDDDPDAAFRFACAYNAQVIVLDMCWESLLQTIEAAAGDNWLVMLLGVRGYSLGEHGHVGGVDHRMYAEGLHVPWLVRFPGNLGRLVRSSALTSHVDVLPTLLDWADNGKKLDRSSGDGVSVVPLASSARVPWREVLISSSDTSRAVRTASWGMRESLTPSNDGDANDSPPHAELFVRPDDRWEANDVAKLCPDVVEELRALVAGHSEAGAGVTP